MRKELKLNPEEFEELLDGYRRLVKPNRPEKDTLEVAEIDLWSLVL